MPPKKEKPADVILVSACLVGLNTRYDGRNSLNKKVIKQLNGKVFIPICPEQLGGLSTPRRCAQISNGNGKDVLAGKARVIDESGSDVTNIFLRGAIEALKIAKLARATHAILKEKSPSCGVKWIKRGAKSTPGPGVTAAALMKANVKIQGA